MDDDDLIPLSALQHYLYCPRQCALIHIEQLWAETAIPPKGGCCMSAQTSRTPNNAMVCARPPPCRWSTRR
ncbi:hypothetical protein C8K63_101499 [Pseudomonas sp. GV085]|nr:hypothetical protein C8K63_101499 [Pseudomonas sp. GV085]